MLVLRAKFLESVKLFRFALSGMVSRVQRLHFGSSSFIRELRDYSLAKITRDEDILRLSRVVLLSPSRSAGRRYRFASQSWTCS